MRAASAILLTLLMGGCSLSPDSAGSVAGPTTAGSRIATAGGPAAGAPAAGATAAASTTTATATAATAAPIAEAQHTHEVPTPAPRQTVAGGWHSPAQAVQAFASAYVNWNYRTISLHLRALAEVSVGQARSMLTMTATQVAHDGELRHGEIANSGVVEAVGPVAGRADVLAVVTRERTTAATTNAYRGLAPAWHVALATVMRVRGLWVLSAWQPES